jgi:hypothetical protein
MKATLIGAIDGRAAVSLIGQVPDEGLEAWQAQVTSTLMLFDAFVGAGGLPAASAAESGPVPPGRLEWEPSRFTHIWPSFPFGAVGLVVVLRMLDRLRRGDSRIGPVTVRGTPTNPEHPVAIHHLEAAANRLPPRSRHLPFRLELCPYGDWVNIECELTPTFSPEVPQALHDAIWLWGKVANASGFQVADETQRPSLNGAFGVGIEGPIVGDDFLEWYCLKTGVTPESLNCLINILAVFSTTTFPLQSVYIG